MPEKMFCPRCGKAFDEGTSFCRTCGLELSGVTTLVTGDEANAPEFITRPNGKLMRAGIAVFIFGTALALVTAAVKDLGLFPESLGKMVFLFVVSIGMLLIGSGFVFPSKVYKKRSRVENQDPAPSMKNLETAPLANSLEPGDPSASVIDFPADNREKAFAEPGSVTERTTRNLEQN